MDPQRNGATPHAGGVHGAGQLHRFIAHALASSDRLARSVKRLETRAGSVNRRGAIARLARSTDALRASQGALVSAAESLRRSAVAVVRTAAV